MTLRRPLLAAGVICLALLPAGAADDQSPGEIPTAATPLAEQPLERLSATRERPLFSPTRRPPPTSPTIVEGPPPPPPPPAPPAVALLGVVMDGESARAIIRPSPAEKMTRVGIGDDVGGWKVAQIEARRLVLSLGERLATFEMFSGKATKAEQQTDSVAPTPTVQLTDTNPLQQIQTPSPAKPPPSKPTRPHRLRQPN
jgi:hypothetical protein